MEKINHKKTVQTEIDEIKSLLAKAEIVKGIHAGPISNIEDLIEKQHVETIEMISDSPEVKKEKPIIISVDCVANTEEDIAKGGPLFLGYDFVVEQEKADEMRHFITMQIKKYKQPLIKTYVNFDESLTEEQIWNQQQIIDCISKGF